MYYYFSSDMVAFNNASIFSSLVNKLKIQLIDALYYFCNFFRKSNLRKKGRVTECWSLVYSVGMEMIYRDFNILRLIRAMHDLERLKSMLLTEEQLEFFNSLPKPLVLIK
jgi:hypothetical protein